MKRHIQLLVILLLPSIILAWCSNRSVAPSSTNSTLSLLDTLTTSNLLVDSVTPFMSHLEELPEPCVDMHVNYLGHNYGKVFNDSNYIHWNEAEKIGITPLTDLRSYWKATRGLTKIASCRDYYVEELNFSRPFLVAEASQMLAEIGRRFRDSIDARGGGNYRIKVTSVMRTPQSIARLRRRNSNAVDSSVHSLATTIDISHSSFIADDAAMPRSVNDLKGILSEVLYAMRNEGKCYVKYERKQPCFHITVCNHPDYSTSKKD